MTRWYDRALLVVLLLFTLLLAGVLITCLSPVIAGNAAAMLASFVEADANRMVLLGTGVLLALICIRLFVGLSGPKPVKGPDAVLMSTTPDGSAQIAVPALEGMILRCASKSTAVREVHTRLTVSEHNDVTIYLRVLPAPDVVLPEVTQELQTGVKAYIQQHAGIPVREVIVLIDAAPKAAPQPPRVE